MFLLAWATLAGAAEVIVFGDSWADQSGAILGDVLADRGYPYAAVNYGLSGSTAEAWNDLQPNALVDAVTLNPDARWVWLSILGNDTFLHHSENLSSSAAALNEAELAEMMDRLFAVHPDVRVVTFGYDWVNFEQTRECRTSAWLYFPAYTTVELIFFDLVNTAAINEAFVRDVADVQARVAQSRPQLTALRFFGTLQADAGSLVSPLLPSPASHMRDCIHPTDEGYERLHEVMVDAYWGAPQPSASLQGPGVACRDQSVTFTSTSQGASTLAWTRDGVAAGTGGSLSFVATSRTDVRLRAGNGAWQDDATQRLEVVDRPTVDAGPDVQICAGEAAQLNATGGPVRWTPETGLDHPTRADPVARPMEDITYTATAAPAPGCEASDTVTVTVLPSPTVAVQGPERAQEGEPVTLTAAGDAQAPFTWTVDGVLAPETAAELTRTWSEAGVHTVTVEARSGACSARATHSVAVGDVAVDSDTDAAPTEDTALEPPPYLARPGACGCATPHAPTGGVWITLLVAGLRRRRGARASGAHATR